MLYFFFAKGSFLRAGAVYGLANILSASVPFLLLPILTRVLSPAQYGEVISFYILVAVCTSVAGLSAHGAVGVRWLSTSKGNASRYTASAILLVIATTAVAAVGASILAPKFGISLPTFICVAAAMVAGVNVLQGMRFAVWQSREQALQAATLQVSSAVVNITFSLIAVLIFHMGGEGRIIGAATASALVGVYCVYSLIAERAATRPSVDDTKHLLRFGIPLIPHVLAGALLANADRLAVSSQMSAVALGIYGVASQLGLVINMLADAFTKAYTPTLYRMLNADTARSRLKLVGVTYLSIPAWLFVGLALWFCYRILGPILLGDNYLGAIELSIWFLLGGALCGIYLNFAGLFFFTGKTEWISFATVGASLLTLGIATTAVSRMGLFGAAATYVFAQLSLLFLAWALSCKIKPMPWRHPILAIRVLLRKFRRTR